MMQTRATEAIRQEYRLYGRRRARRLRAELQKTLDDGLVRWGIARGTIEKAEAQNLPPGDFFDKKYAEYFLEIGFGGGEHVYHLAKTNPQAGIIGCEAFENGVAQLMQDQADEAQPNLRVYDNDARDLMRALKPKSFARIYVLFADPWPKKRHHKRRLIKKENLEAWAGLLADGGALYIATDHASYRDWIAEELSKQSVFTVPNPLWSDMPWDGYIKTRYQQKAEKAGRIPRFLCLKKR